MKHKLGKLGKNRKYRRLAAAVAGAAVLSSTMITGLPLAKVQASPQASVGSSRATGADANTPAPAPVQALQNTAATYGFNNNNDHYKLLSQSDRQAAVQVRSSGQLYKVNMTLDGNNWVVKDVRSTGGQSRPATLSTGGWLASHAVTALPTISAAIPVTNAATPLTLYQTDQYAGWTWNQGTYPSDMSFGVLMQAPQAATATVPATLLAQLAKADFSRQFVLFAHLGSVSGNGYGIAIEKVMQTGNNLTVTVHTKTPQPNETGTPSTIDAYIAVERGAIDLSNPVNAIFIDQNGSTLGNATVNAGYV